MNFKEKVLIFMLLCALMLFTAFKIKGGKPEVIYQTRVVTVDNTLEFSEVNLLNLLKKLNVKFPYIVVAQSRLETATYTSDLFHDNNNLFGMKTAATRPTTSKGDSKGHASYENWVESVYDYAFYQGAFLRNIRTEQQYLDYLGRNYAEDPDYVNKVKKIYTNLKEVI